MILRRAARLERAYEEGKRILEMRARRRHKNIAPSTT